MDFLLTAFLGRRTEQGKKIKINQPSAQKTRVDSRTCLLNRPCKLKRHLSEKMSIVHWPGSVPHISGKVVNIIFFWFFLPQMIHYMTVNQEPGVEWSPMSLHMHTSTAQPPHPTPPAQDTGDLDVQHSAQALMSEMTQSRGL